MLSPIMKSSTNQASISNIEIKESSHRSKTLSALEVLHPLKFFSQNMHRALHTAFLAQPFLASVLFVTAKYCQTKCASSFCSSCSRFALSMSLIVEKKLLIVKSLRKMNIKILERCRQLDSNTYHSKTKFNKISLYYGQPALSPLHYTGHGFFKHVASLQYICLGSRGGIKFQSIMKLWT